MNLTQNITIQVNLPRPESEIERSLRAARNWAAWINRGINNHIAREQHNGNALFANITTHEQYLAACAADEKRKRRELGFWRYHFGR